ncbi:hypothetical protein [Pararhodobacter zhoushanensis]|uniref:hypothetical protein n=1 Tax=Pararhodobacter zhoushanensis TaxID=2479545 RepID=UPI000F8CD2B9|nr:hypothetical protein [Pararhodobacter zhoushanensis]
MRFPRFTRTPLVIAALLAPFPALAQMEPGFWAYPDQPGLDAAALAASCETGFSLVYADGSAQSFLLVEAQETTALWLDSERTCETNADNSMTCTGWVDNGDGPVEFQQVTRFLLEGEALRAETLTEGAANDPVVTYPQPCPADAIRAAFRQGMFPRG